MLNAMDRALVERDAAVPGLAALLDSTRMEALVAEQASPKEAFSLSGKYLRYKPGVSCLARYQVRTSKGSAWAYAKAFGKDSDAKYGKLKMLDAIPGLLGVGRLFFDQQQMVFSMFPNDSRMRVLQRLEDADYSRNVLQRIFKDIDGWDQPQYQVLSYKPERRLAARFSNGDGQNLLVKFYESGEFKRIRKYRKRLSTPDGLPMQKWIGGSKSYRALVFSWLEGQSLAQVSGPKRDLALDWAGQALASWHLSEQPGLRKRRRSEESSNLIALAEGIKAICPAQHERAVGMAVKLGRWWRRQARERVAVHGDFDASQVIIGEQSASLIDGDEAHLGNAISDLACFRARAEYEALLNPGTASDPGSEQERLMSGYCRIRPQPTTNEFAKYVAWHLLHLLHTPFRCRLANWPEFTEQLLDHCWSWWEKT